MFDYITENLWLFWTLVTIVALILELSSGTFYLICFAIGALAAILCALFHCSIWIQVVVFILGSLLSVFAVRPFILKFLHPNKATRVSNADALIGKEGIVIEPVSADYAGYVRVDGDEWKAVTKEKNMISNGEKVKIIGRDSIVVTVQRVK